MEYLPSFHRGKVKWGKDTTLHWDHNWCREHTNVGNIIYSLSMTLGNQTFTERYIQHMGQDASPCSDYCGAYLLLDILRSYMDVTTYA